MTKINSLHISHEEARKKFMTDKELLIWQKREIEKQTAYIRQLERQVVRLVKERGELIKEKTKLKIK